MPGEDRITTVQFTYDEILRRSDVIAYWTDGSFGHLLTFYADEIHFRADELIGLTEAEARALHHKKDKEYLQS